MICSGAIYDNYDNSTLFEGETLETPAKNGYNSTVGAQVVSAPAGGKLDLFKNVDPAVRKETGFIACVTLILSVLMQAVFLVIGQWDVTVLLGNLLGGGLAVLNFFLMGLGIQKALTKEEKDAKSFIKVSQQLRMLMMLVVCAVGAALPWFNLYALLIPLLFPRIGVGIRGVMLKKEK